MSASRLPVVVELEDGYAVTFDDCGRDGDRYVVSISAVDGEDFHPIPYPKTHVVRNVIAWRSAAS